jgi:hypothetical protein
MKIMLDSSFLPTPVNLYDSDKPKESTQFIDAVQGSVSVEHNGVVLYSRGNVSSRVPFYLLAGIVVFLIYKAMKG